MTALSPYANPFLQFAENKRIKAYFQMRGNIEQFVYEIVHTFPCNFVAGGIIPQRGHHKCPWLSRIGRVWLA
ncbi:hypothetical protein SAMN03159496_01503 [Rhizobium sp. NFR07]|nr:hypothetical protein SAMN03159496_01503 [Rhizobium sp. NFR07]